MTTENPTPEPEIAGADTSPEPRSDAPKPEVAELKDPLHGVTLKALLTDLVDRYSWSGLADQIDLACFRKDPSIKSSLKFLRKTPWARGKVERLYVSDVRKAERNRKRNAARAQRRAWAKAAAEAAAVEKNEPESP